MSVDEMHWTLRREKKKKTKLAAKNKLSTCSKEFDLLVLFGLINGSRVNQKKIGKKRLKFMEYFPIGLKCFPLRGKTIFLDF